MKRLIVIAMMLFCISAMAQDDSLRYRVIETLPPPTYDTIHVLMLVSDTSRLVAPAYSVKGYKIVENNWFINSSVIYTDERKRPLDKSIKIWIIQYIK